MFILSRCLRLSLSLIALSLLGTSPSFADSLQREPLISQRETSETTVVEVTELTITPPLSTEQQNQLREIDQAYQPKINKAMEDYSNSFKIFESLLGTNPETETLQEKRKKMLDDRRIVLDLAFDRLMDFREVLTPEQKASLSDDVRQLMGK